MNKVSKEFVMAMDGVLNGKVWHSATIKGAKHDPLKGIALRRNPRSYSWENLLLVQTAADWENSPYWTKSYSITKENMMATDWREIDEKTN